MPATSSKQVNAARLAGAVKKGKFSKSKAGKAVKSMSKMSMSKLKKFMKLKESMTLEQKKRLLSSLKALREIMGGNTDIANQDNPIVNEDEYTDKSVERNVIAKTFDTEADFDSYVNQRRGIEMTQKELQAIANYSKVKPTQQDKFFAKYEHSDTFGTNNTTVIKKLKEGQQFCWTAFSKYESSDASNSINEDDMPSEPEENDEITVNDKIRITKSITFIDETEGADILSDFLKKLDI